MYSVFSCYIIAWTASKPLSVFAKNLWCSTGFYTPLVSLDWVSYVGISMIIATLASCDQVIFEVNLCVLFKYVCVCFVKLETEFREIRHSWQINEITCLNEKIFFRCTLFIDGLHLFWFRKLVRMRVNLAGKNKANISGVKPNPASATTKVWGEPGYYLRRKNQKLEIFQNNSQPLKSDK